MAKRPAQFSSETQFLTEEDIANEGEEKIDSKYFAELLNYYFLSVWCEGKLPLLRLKILFTMLMI